MLFNGITLVEGSELQNLIVGSGPAFPSTAVIGELYYITLAASKGLYIYQGSQWIRITDSTNSIAFTPVNKAGDTMLGILRLSAAPVNALDAATKQYVDSFKPSFENISAKPTTIAGYGITDAQVKDSDLTAIANITTTGFVVRSGDGVATARVLKSTDGTIAVTNGNGVNGEPSIDLVKVGTPGTYGTVMTDEYGRVINGLSGANWIDILNKPTTVAGFGITDAAPRSSPVFSGTPTAPTAANGTNTTQLATTQFVQSAVSLIQQGAVTSAAKWTTPRTLSFTGDATGSMSVDGSANVSAAVTLATVNGAVGSFGSTSQVPVITANAKGLITGVYSTSIGIGAGQVTSGTFADARIAASNVTQHQAAISIAESQIIDGAIFPRVSSNENISGAWSFATRVQGVTPVLSLDLATKGYVDDVASGLDTKASVKIATTGANIALTGLQTIDGYTLVSLDRILVKDQTNPAQNGIYVARAGTWARSADANGTNVSPGMYTFVEQGTINGDTGWILSTDGAITIDTTPLNFYQFTGTGQINVGYGLTKTGNAIALAPVDNTGVGTLAKYTIDGYGRVLGSAAVVSSDLTPILNSVYQALNGSLTSIGGLTGTSGLLRKTAANTYSLDTTTYLSGVVQPANGGTGSTSITGLVYGNGTGAMTAASGTQIVSAIGSTSVQLATFAGTATTVATTDDTATNSTFYPTFVQSAGTVANKITTTKLTFNPSSGILAATSFSGAGTGLTGSAGSLSVGGTAANVTGIVAVANGGTAANNAASARTNLGAAASASPVFTGLSRSSVANAIAAAGTTLATATALAAEINLVTTVVAGSGVILPNSGDGMKIIVINLGANALNVYPPSGGRVDSAAAGVAFSLPPAAKIMFISTSTTQYYTLNATYA